LGAACAVLLTAAVACAQPAAPPESLAALEQTAIRAAAAWQVLATNLENRVAYLLPCDPKLRTAVEEVSRASQARLAAVAQYYQAAGARAASQNAEAKRLLAAEEARAGDASENQMQADEVLAAFETRAAVLAESARRRPALSAAQKPLQEAIELARQSAALAKEQADRKAAALAALRDLAAGYQARENALQNQMVALEAERARWNAYYAARLTRAQVECSVTTGAAPSRPGPRVKK
jgi:chromosome segregation ATPase